MRPLLVDRRPLSEDLRHTVVETIALDRAERDQARRHAQHWPLRNRYLIVRARERSTWREVWADLVYLVRG